MRFHHIEPQEKIICVWPASGGVIPYATSSSLKLFRPASANRCIPARVWVFDDLPAPLSRIYGREIDISQGLLVLHRRVIEQSLGHRAMKRVGE